MPQHRPFRFRPSLLDRLEDRVVPSGGVAHAQVTAAAATTSAASRLATLETQLGTAGAQVNAAFSTFASSIRQVETSLVATSSGTATIPTVAAIDAQISTLASTLASSVASAYGGVTAIGSNATVIASGLSGTGDGSLSTQLQALVGVAGFSGEFDQSTLPLLFASVEATMGVGYSNAAIEGFVAGVGGSGLISASASASPFNLTTFGAQANAAYGTLAESIRGAEMTLPTSSGAIAGTPIGSGTVASFQAEVTTAADTLASSLVTAVTGTTAEPIVALRAQEESIPLAYFGPLATVAAPTGVVSTADLPLVLADGEVGINGSYGATAIQAYLIATFTS